MKTQSLETFESCGLKWLPCGPETRKPDWLPDGAPVRVLSTEEFEGTAPYLNAVYTMGFPFVGCDRTRIAGWHPVDESLIPRQEDKDNSPSWADRATVAEARVHELEKLLYRVSRDQQGWHRLLPSLRGSIRAALDEVDEGNMKAIKASVLRDTTNNQTQP